MLISWCQAENWDLSDFLALRDYWTAWEPGKNIWVTMLNNRQISLMRFCLYSWSFNNLRICSFKSRYELHPQKCYKMNLPTDEIVSSWLVSLLNCPVTYSCNLSPSVYKILHQIELLTANKLSGKCVWKANTKGCEHQSRFLTCLNICETLFLIIFPVLVEI